MSPLGSGFHFPFSMHVAELGPVSTSPGGQLNMTVFPSIGKPAYTALILGTVESLLVTESSLMGGNNSGYPQLTIQNLKLT